MAQSHHRPTESQILHSPEVARWLRSLTEPRRPRSSNGTWKAGMSTRNGLPSDGVRAEQLVRISLVMKRSARRSDGPGRPRRPGSCCSMVSSIPADSSWCISWSPASAPASGPPSAVARSARSSAAEPPGPRPAWACGRRRLWRRPGASRTCFADSHRARLFLLCELPRHVVEQRGAPAATSPSKSTGCEGLAARSAAYSLLGLGRALPGRHRRPSFPRISSCGFEEPDGRRRPDHRAAIIQPNVSSRSAATSSSSIRRPVSRMAWARPESQLADVDNPVSGPVCGCRVTALT
jgi:hypothetical protein